MVSDEGRGGESRRRKIEGDLVGGYGRCLGAGSNNEWGLAIVTLTCPMVSFWLSRSILCASSPPAPTPFCRPPREWAFPPAIVNTLKGLSPSHSVADVPHNVHGHRQSSHLVGPNLPSDAFDQRGEQYLIG